MERWQVPPLSLLKIPIVGLRSHAVPGRPLRFLRGCLHLWSSLSDLISYGLYFLCADTHWRYRGDNNISTVLLCVVFFRRCLSETGWGQLGMWFGFLCLERWLFNRKTQKTLWWNDQDGNLKMVSSFSSTSCGIFKNQSGFCGLMKQAVYDWSPAAPLRNEVGIDCNLSILCFQSIVWTFWGESCQVCKKLQTSVWCYFSRA